MSNFSTCLKCGRLALASVGCSGFCWDAGGMNGKNSTHCSSLEGFCNFSDAPRLKAEHGVLCDILLSDLVDMLGNRPTELDTTLSNNADSTTLGAHIGITVFFRLLRSLQQRKNTQGVLKLIKQVPSSIRDTPALSLSPYLPTGECAAQDGPRMLSTTAYAELTTSSRPGRVVDEIMSAAEDLLCGAEHDLSITQQGDVLEAMVGLAVKRGSLAHCLRVVKLLFCSTAAGRGLTLSGVGHHIKELERTQPSAAGDPGALLSLDTEGCRAGKLYDPDEERELLTDRGYPSHCFSWTSSLPPALLKVDILKVTSTACQHIALTAEGELLIWAYENARAAGRAAATSAPLSGVYPTRGVHIWRPKAQGRVDSLTGAGDSLGRDEIGHVGTPSVWKVLADKPNVKDVACGEEHTLALLETGVVFAWGSGRNGRLGLEDVLDRKSACHVEALEGIEIEAVSCGVSHSLAICSKGTCYAWGKNNCGQCGDADTLPSDVLTPNVIEGLKNTPVAMIVGGREHTLTLTYHGALFSFGGGFMSGEDIPPVLGASATATVPAKTIIGKHGGVSPTRVCGNSFGNTTVKKIASGWDHCLAVTNDGELFTWGSGRDGQLGHGDTEPRHTPTLVAFFGTPAGGRVRSAVGGRSYSAAVTSDGRVLKWGLNSKLGSPLDNEHSRHIPLPGASGRRNNRTEETGAARVEAPVPQLVPEIGVEGPRVVRLSEGGSFGFVLVELGSCLDRQPLPPGGCQKSDLSDVSTRGLMASAGLNVHEDPAQPVGRIETAVALLHHFERLATPHIPTDSTHDLERSVRQVVRVGKRIQNRLQRSEGAALVSPTCDPDLSALSSADDQQFLTRVKTSVSGDDNVDPGRHAPMCSVDELHGNQEALATLWRIPSLVVPFCVDPSRRAFRSFLDLIQGIRGMKSMDHTVSIRNPADIKSADSSGVPNGKNKGKAQVIADKNGPESCEKPIPRSFVKSETVDTPGCRKQTAPAAPVDEETFASRSVQMEVLRGAVKMLKVNLFHLVRVAAIRRACRANGFCNPCSAKIQGNPEDRKTGPKCDRQGASNCCESKCRETKSVVRQASKETNIEHADDPRHFYGTQLEDSAANTSSTVLHGKTLERSCQRKYQTESECGASVHSLIGELHAEVQAMLKEHISEEDKQMADAARAVQMEAAEAFRVGFSVFYPSNLARVRLLMEIATATKATGSIPPERTGQDLRDEEKLRRRNEKLQNRIRPVPQASGLMMRLEVEGLARKEYAAALVNEAFDHKGPPGEAGEENGTEERVPRNEIWESGENFDVTKLDTVMQSLLSYCADNLHMRLWGSKCPSANATLCRQEKERYESPCTEEHAAGCPHPSLLLVLQEHIVVCWGDTDGSDDRQAAARELTLAHTSRLLGESLQVFTRLLTDGEQHVGNKRSQKHLTDSFMSLIPVLCTSWLAIPAEGEGFLWRAAALLPLVVPLIRAVDCFNRSRASAAETAAVAIRDKHSASSWLIDFEEVLAMLCSELVCGVIDVNPTKLPYLVEVDSHEHYTGDSVGGGSRNRSDGPVEDDIAELLMASSPFLGFDREGFDWSGREDRYPSQADHNVFSHALEVIAFQEKNTPEICGCSSPSGLMSAAPTTEPNGPYPQHSLAPGGRRGSHDSTAKLSPIDASMFRCEVAGKELQSKTPTKSQGSSAVARGGAEGKKGRNGGATGHHLHSIVDEARAEDFIQDLLCGQGAAAALYHWMTVPPEPQLPLLHAASLATQGQGWGSYQSLASHAISNQHEIEAGLRRRRSRALPSDVDAATRAIVAVMIKTNGLVTEAATFSRCRLDRSSSPPRALKLVAEAAVEVREVLTELADSLEGDTCTDAKETTEKHGNHRYQNGREGGFHPQHDVENNSTKHAASVAQLAAATLATIVRKCRFLLTCTTRLPSVELARKSCQKDTPSCPRDRSYSRLPTDDRQARQELSRALRRWTAGARDNSNGCLCCPSADESTVPSLAFILQHMVNGRVKKALSAAVTAEKYFRSPGTISLESLVVFAANPISLEAIRKRMRHHMLGATVRTSGFRLIHGIINDVRDSAARRQMSARLARSLCALDGGSGNPALFDGIQAGGQAATCRVRTAYFDLFRHVLYEVEQEHSNLKKQDDIDKASSTPLLVLLSLLQTLTTMLTPSLLCHASSTTPFEERLTPSLVSRKSGSSSPCPAPAGPKSGVIETHEQPFRAGRSSSCPSIDLADTRGSKPSSETRQEPISTLTTAIPVLGSILSGHGDLLTPKAWTKEATNIHNAAWQALGMTSLQLCSSAPAWATNTSTRNRSFESEQSTTRRPASSPKRLKRQSFAQEWWAAMQGTLVVLFKELLRTRQCLEQLQRSTRAREEVLGDTGAVRLMTGPVSLPLPATWTFPHEEQEERMDVYAVSFWVWEPAQPALWKPDLGPSAPRADCFARANGDALQRGTIFTLSSRDSPQDGAIGTPGRYTAILLRQPSPRDKIENPGITDDDAGGYYVGTYVGRKPFPGTPVGRKTSSLDDVKGSGDAVSSTPDKRLSDRLDEEAESPQDGEDGNGQALQTESVFSKCPLRSGQWTHVYCGYSNSRDGGDVATSVGAQPSCDCATLYTDITIAFNGTIVARRTVSSCAVGCKAGRMASQGQADECYKVKADGNHDYASPGPDSVHSWSSEQWRLAHAVCDVCFHRLEASQDQASQMASYGIPTQENDKQRSAETYVTRLVALAEKLSACSTRVVATLSSPRWLSLWFQLVVIAEHHAKRAIVRLLRPLLCIPSQMIGDGMDGGAASRVEPGSPHSPPFAENDFCDQKIVDSLCGLLGGSLVPLLSGRSRDRVLVGGGHEVSRRTSSQIRQDSGMLSEIVLLLRSLVKEAPVRWREHVFTVLTNGLGTAARAGLPALQQPTAEQEESMPDWEKQHSTWLGAAAAAAYLGGGLIEGPRLGSRVMLLPRPGYKPFVSVSDTQRGHGGKRSIDDDEKLLRDIVGAVCMPAEALVLGEGALKGACCGTVVGWVQNRKEKTSPQDEMAFVAIDEEFKDNIDEMSGNNPAAQRTCYEAMGIRHSIDEPWCRVVAASRQATFSAEATETVTPFLFQTGLTSMLALIDSPPIPRGGNILCTRDEGESGGEPPSEIGCNLILAHLRCRLLRALAAQVRHPGQANAALQGKVLRPLLALGGLTLASAVVLALGSDGAVAFGRRRDFAAVILSLRSHGTTGDHSLRLELETACQIVWDQLSRGTNEREERRPGYQSQTDSAGNDDGVEKRGPTCPRPTLQVLGGDALIEGNRVTASSHFPTIRLSGVGVGSGSLRGRWYYEVTLMTGGLMQLGWAAPSFRCSPTSGQGVGDAEGSWAFDGFRQKRWSVASAPYGKRWRAGDVIGVLLDSGLQEMRFSLNGGDLGVAFVGFDVQGLYPAASMNVGQAADFNFGHGPFMYAPTDGGRLSFQSISEAVILTAASGHTSMDRVRPREQSAFDVRRYIAEDRVEAGCIDDDAQADDNVHARDSDGDGDMHRDGEEDGGRLEIERQALVENMIGMGFPVEWAIRAAGRSGAVMSESAATAWIIERLEVENTEMEEEMGNLDTCEEDSADGHSGVRDEYNDVGESDDGGTDACGFAFSAEAAGIERLTPGDADRVGEELGDRRWHNMYSAVRRNFLARGSGESPATTAIRPGQLGPDSCATAGVATGAGRTQNHSADSCTTASILRAVEGVAPVEQLGSTSPQLPRIAMSADKVDLPSLSLVFETALSILFARAAVVNLLTHAAGRSGPCCPYVIAQVGVKSTGKTCPSERLDPRTTKGHGKHDPVVEGSCRPSFDHVPWGDNWHGAEVATDVTRNLLEELTIPEHQRRIVDLTKAFSIWHLPSQSTASTDDFKSAGQGIIAVIERNGSIENSKSGGFPAYVKTVDPIGLSPGSYLAAMRSLFGLVVDALIHRKDWKARLPEPSARRAKEGDPLHSNMQDSDDAASRPARIASLARLVRLFVHEAIATFETDPILKFAESGTHGLTTAEKKGEGANFSAYEPLASRPNYSWALWVLETLLELETRDEVEGGIAPRLADEGAVAESVWTATKKDDDAGDDKDSLQQAAASARSFQAFSIVLRSAIGNDMGEPLQSLAYSLCSRILNTSRLTLPKTFNKSTLGLTEMQTSTADSLRGNAPKHAAIPEAEENALQREEHALARAFSTRLRSQISTPCDSSFLLQSQLELLAQWELQRSAVRGESALDADGTRRPGEVEWDQNERTARVKKPPSPQVWVNTDRKYVDSWDVATALFAGAEEGSDGFETTRARKSRVAGRGKRTGTAESEASALSCLPTPHFLGKLTPPHHNSLLVEAVSATSVTVSWGGWFETDDEPELQVGVGGDGLAFPVAFGQVAGASDLAQALRSKLKHASNRRRNEGPSLVLKVSACGLWGSEPFHVAALDLDGRGCLKVNGLAADTRYSFRLERHETSPSQAPAPPTADMSDDENSCFPSVATVGANSTGGSSADQLVADVADCASAMTGMDGSCGEGGGGASTCSEGCTTVLTDESRRQGGQMSCCTSSTRAVAGRYLSPSSGDRYANRHTIDRNELHWPALGLRDRPGGATENLVSGRVNGAIVASLSVATPPEVPFMLDAEGCGPNLLLTNSNHTVVNVGRKKWSAVRATRGFTCGLHRWQVRIDRCASKNVFVGVMALESRLDNYVGSDRSGWGYLANKAIWHNKSKVRSYGDLFREGDTIGVKLNMDLGTLRFSRNGRDLGLAVQGLEGTLYPAFSMYNRTDQLTFIPQGEDSAPSHLLSSSGGVDEKNGKNPRRVGGRLEARNTSCSIIYGAFSAECVVRRAAKAVEVLGVLHDHVRFANSPARAELAENICSRLREWSRGEHGRSVPSARSCAPVRLDTSEQARRDLFGLGVGDRVLSAEGEAVVLGATKHSLWVEVEPTSSSSANSSGFSRGSRAWDPERGESGQEDASQENRGHNASSAETTAMSSPRHRRIVGRRGSRIMSWSRCTVRQIFNNPEDYVVSRHETPLVSEERLTIAKDVGDRDDGGQDEVDGVAASTIDHLRADEVRNMLSRWTRAMDEQLEHHLTKLADSVAVASPLDLPFDALRKLPPSNVLFPYESPIAPAEVWARVALLLYVNDLILPLLPLVDTSSDDRGPLSMLIHKCKHLVFQVAKISFLDSAVRPSKAVSPSESGRESAPTSKIRVVGVKALPNAPVTPLCSTKPFVQSWAQTSTEVDKSVFGQVAAHLSSSLKHTVSEGAMAFLVELVDASIVTDDESASGGSLQLADTGALYRGVFWQVCMDIFSSPISMFVCSPAQTANRMSSVTSGQDAVNASGNNEVGGSNDVDQDAVPNPLFVSSGMCMDPGRISLYRSFGLIAGLAVRTGVPLPLSNLSPTWWMLVSGDESSSIDSPAAVGGRPASGATRKEAARGRPRPVRPDEAVPSDSTKDPPPLCAVDEVLTKLNRLEETGLKKEELDELLLDARFVAPLSNGLVAELLPGGLHRPVTHQNLGEYRTRLARLRVSEYAPQALAFRAGMETSLPKRMLSLLTWRQMEKLVCGDVTFGG